VKPLRPFFHYFGAKWSAGARYPKPSFPHIVEPFAGSACYSLRYYDRKVTLIDLDPIVAGIWDYLINVKESEVLSLPMLGPYGSVDDLGDIPQEAKWLVGFWLVVAVGQPAKRVGGWMRKKLEGTSETWGDTFWSPRMRERIASQLKHIRHWDVACGSYESIGPMEATWYVDPPYQVKGKGYKYHDIDYGHLGDWCLGLRGQVIVCEQRGATWLPFESLHECKSTKGKSHEAIYYKETNHE